MKKKSISNLIKFTGLIIFIIIILTQINVKKFYFIFSSINPWLLLLAPLIFMPVLLANMFRWYYILRRLKIIYPISRVAKIYFISSLLSAVTPLSSGEIIGRIGFLKKDGFKIKTALISYFIDRLAALVVLLLISIFGVLFFLPLFGEKILLLPILFLLLIVVGFFSLKINCFKKLAKKIFYLIIPPKYYLYLEQHFKEILKEIENFNFKDFSVILGLTALSQTGLFLFSYFLTRVLGIYQVPALYLLVVNAVATFVVLIPVSVGGLGTREAAMLMMFSFFGVQNELTIIFSLLFVITANIPVLIIGAYFWFAGEKKFIKSGD